MFICSNIHCSLVRVLNLRVKLKNDKFQQEIISENCFTASVLTIKVSVFLWVSEHEVSAYY